MPQGMYSASKSESLVTAVFPQSYELIEKISALVESQIHQDKKSPVRQSCLDLLAGVLSAEVSAEEHYSLLLGALVHVNGMMKGMPVQPAKWLYAARHSESARLGKESGLLLEKYQVDAVGRFVHLVALIRHTEGKQTDRKLLASSVSLARTAVKELRPRIEQLCARQPSRETLFGEVALLPGKYNQSHSHSLWRQDPKRQEALCILQGVRARLLEKDISEKEAGEALVGALLVEMHRIERQYRNSFTRPDRSALYREMRHLVNVHCTSDLAVELREADLSALDHVVTGDCILPDKNPFWEAHNINRADLDKIKNNITAYRYEMMHMSDRDFANHPMVNGVINQLLDSLALAAAEGGVMFAAWELASLMTRNRIGLSTLTSLFVRPEYTLLFVATMWLLKKACRLLNSQIIHAARDLITPLVCRPVQAVLLKKPSIPVFPQLKPLDETEKQLLRALCLAPNSVYAPGEGSRLKEKLGWLFPEVAGFVSGPEENSLRAG